MRLRGDSNPHLEYGRAGRAALGAGLRRCCCCYRCCGAGARGGGQGLLESRARVRAKRAPQGREGGASGEGTKAALRRKARALSYRACAAAHEANREGAPASLLACAHARSAPSRCRRRRRAPSLKRSASLGLVSACAVRLLQSALAPLSAAAAAGAEARLSSAAERVEAPRSPAQP